VGKTRAERVANAKQDNPSAYGDASPSSDLIFPRYQLQFRTVLGGGLFSGVSFSLHFPLLHGVIFESLFPLLSKGSLRPQ
jgi:hypothetical protein